MAWRRTSGGRRWGAAAALAATLLIVAVPIAQAGTSVADPTFEQRIAPDPIEDEAEEFGMAVDRRPGLVVVGAPGDDTQAGDAGAVYVFERAYTGQWWNTQTLFAEDASWGDSFGMAVSLSGDTLAVGAPQADGQANSDGAVYVFRQQPGFGWGQEAKITLPDPPSYASFGFAVDLEGEQLAAGAPRYDGDEGAAFVAQRAGGVWSQPMELTKPADAEDDRFGHDVALAQGSVIVGAPGDSDGSEPGQAYVYPQGPATVQPGAIEASDAADGDAFGWSVDAKAGQAIVGAPGAEVTTSEADEVHNAGKAYVFATGSWIEETRLEATTPEKGESLGRAVAIGDNLAAAGAPQHGIYERGRALLFERAPAEAWPHPGTGKPAWVLAERWQPQNADTYARYGTSLAFATHAAAVGAPHNGDGTVDLFTTP